MPRSMSEKYDEAFRIAVRITIRHLSGGVSYDAVSYYGPYATVGAARAQSTNMRREHQMYNRSSSFDAWIEKSSAKWERVD